MDGRISAYAFVLCLLCSLDADRRLTVVDAQPTAGAAILTLPVDRRVGGRVDMRCVAMNLEPNHVVEWGINNPFDNSHITLRWGNSTLTVRTRYTYMTIQTNGETVQDLTIIALQSSDADEYICNVREPLVLGGSHVVASDRVTLSVLASNFQFPDDSFPMCSPDGPMTVDTGTELDMRCLSEGMNSVIMMEISQPPPDSNSFTWTPSNTADSLSMSISFTAEVTHDGISFQCVISLVSYPEVRRSCIIGPISIRVTVTEPTTESTTETTESTTIPTAPTQPPSTSPPGNTAAIAGAAAGGVAALLLVLILILICRRRGMIFSNDSNKSHDSTIPAKDELDHRRSDSLVNAEFGRTKAQNDDLYPLDIRQTSQLYAVAVSTNPVHKQNKDSVMYAKPLNKPYKQGSKPDAISREQNHNNPDPPFDGSPSRPVGVATVVMANKKTPPKPRPYSSKTKTDKHVIPSPPADSKNSTHNVVLGRGANQLHSDKVSYASISRTHPQIHDDTEKQTPSTKPVVYADLDLQPESLPNDGQGPSPPVYATVNKS